MGRRLMLCICALSLIATGCLDTPSPSASRPSAAESVANQGSPKTAEVAQPAVPTSAPTTTPTTTTAPPAAPVSSSCITQGSDTYARPYAATAPWNVEACGLAADARSDDWRDRFWYYSNMNMSMGGDYTQGSQIGRHGIEFGLDSNPVGDFSIPVYDKRDATTQIRVFQRDGWAGIFNITPASKIPWNPAWRASSGSDAMMVIRDSDTGRMWSLWGVTQSYYGLPTNDSQCWTQSASFWLPGGGFQPGVDLCVGGADAQRTADKAGYSDYRSYGGNNPKTRGVGIDRYAMLLTPEEVAAGQVRHALSMPVYNTMNGGTTCTEAQMGTNAFGSTCGQAVAPAGNFERNGSTYQGCGEPTSTALSPEAYRRTTVPAGMRFALKATPAEIEGWLDARGYTGAKRTTMRILAVALVNYGWFVTDSTCYRANFQAAGAANPATAAKWRALGIDDDGSDAFDGLITRDRIWTVAPPTNHCVDGRQSVAACPANSATYPS